MQFLIMPDLGAAAPSVEISFAAERR